MNERIKRLRELSVDTAPSVSPERARLVTEYYRSTEGEGLSEPVRRAQVFRHIMANKELYMDPDEMIVGERGPAPKAAPTFPEICVHSMEDLEMLDSREKIPYSVDDDTREIFENEIIPFWRGRSQRERIFGVMADDWLKAYEAGIFTEFMEQRGPGHTVLGDKIYRKGFVDIRNDIANSLEGLDKADPNYSKKAEELKAMDIATDALLRYAKRYADKLKDMAIVENDPSRKANLQLMASICEKVPANPPETFREALQYYWFVHVGVITELNPWDAFNPGRLDQHLYPYYRKEMDEGSLTEEQARELLQALWIKFNNHPAPPKVGVTAKESATYTDFALINLGGLKPDGTDGVNELTYLILDVIEEMRLIQPSTMVQVSSENPDGFLKRAIDIIKTGFGQPSVFNTDAIIQELRLQGKGLEDARAGGASGCVEAGAFGKEAYILTGYFNLPKVAEITLNNGLDPQTGIMVGIDTGDPASFDSFDEFFEAFGKQLNHFIDVKIEGNLAIERMYAQHLPVPFLSLLIDDCVEKGMDYHEGGARYNTSYIQGVGLGTVTDTLTSVKVNVFEEKKVGMHGLLEALKNDFRDNEGLRDTFVNQTPKYGNDDDVADDVMKLIFEAFFTAVDGRPNTRGGEHRINLLPTTVHVYFGSVTGALPDGRRAGEPLSEGISPAQGRDRNGPTSVLKSAGKIDHIRTGGTLLNQKFTPQLLADRKGIDSLAWLIRAYFRMNGHHIQLNVVTADTLREAQLHPEKHRGLIVRVAGYSDYFVDLTKGLQDEIIERTEHSET
ncbi:MAG: glycyl radical enzyme [Candidatus Proteinoplasmatales archaeon SG8-5]|nr:MAG: glycyl radical enzyme [Candidatus Proteinoplasmatales archaeon SG8-5]